jgi:hypothetical protein
VCQLVHGPRVPRLDQALANEEVTKRAVEVLHEWRADRPGPPSLVREEHAAGAIPEFCRACDLEFFNGIGR